MRAFTRRQAGSPRRQGMIIVKENATPAGLNSARVCAAQESRPRPRPAPEAQQLSLYN